MEISLAAEKIGSVLGLPITNSMLMTYLAALVLIAIAIVLLIQVVGIIVRRAGVLGERGLIWLTPILC